MNMEINWECINAISNIVMASIALSSLLLSLYLVCNNRRQRQEDVRARLYFGIVDWQNKYMLKITNVGKETAYRINIRVTGAPISDNLYSFVRDVFKKLSSIYFCLEAGHSAYYLISPTERCANEEGLEKGEKHSSTEIREWLIKYDDEDICIEGEYCDRYSVCEKFSIREFLLIGSFEHKEPIEEIADAILSRDPSDHKIQNSISKIAKNFQM
jgi:hypothetical protein